jgi:hypothetical protein
MIKKMDMERFNLKQLNVEEINHNQKYVCRSGNLGG